MQADLTLPLLVVGIGFLAAIGIGSVAWFNSKRPPGWEASDRPDYVPKVGAESESNPSEAESNSDS